MGEAITARRELQAVEARAYRDMADLNAVLRLTAPKSSACSEPCSNNLPKS